MSAESGVFIDGRWLTGGRHVHVVEKYTGRHLAAVTKARSGHAVQAVAAAESAMSETPMAVAERTEVLRQAAVDLAKERSVFAQMLTKETGKPLLQSFAEVDEATAALHYAVVLASQCEWRTDAPAALASPIVVSGGSGRGVTAIITSRINPLLNAAALFGAAFAAGNSCIIKPPEETPLTTIMLGRIFERSGAGPGWLNIVVGNGRSVGERLLRDDKVTCSVVNGTIATLRRARQLVANRGFFPVASQTALAVVFADADVATAATVCAAKAFDHSGQHPGTVERIYVDKAVYSSFVSAIRDRVAHFSLGDPVDPETNIGCMIKMNEADRVAAWIDEAVRAGAGAVTSTGQRGKQIAPAVVVNVPEQAKLFHERLAGPVVTLHPFTEQPAVPELWERTEELLVFTSHHGETAQPMLSLSVPNVEVYGDRMHAEGGLPERSRSLMERLFRHTARVHRITYHW